VTPREQLLHAVEWVRAAGYRVEFFSKWDSRLIAGNGSFYPRMVMLHHTAGVNSLAGIASGAFGDHEPVPGAHFLIDRDGTVHAITCNVAYHAGKGFGYGFPADWANGGVWGIEIEDLGVGQTMTPEQIDSAAALSAGLLDAMGVGILGVIEHEQWSRTGKVDTRYSLQFWRDHVQTHLDEKEYDMQQDEKVTGIARSVTTSAGLPAEPTVADMLRCGPRALVVAKRTEARVVALAAAVAALDGGQDITAAIDAALARYLGGDMAATVQINVAPPA
jgi:N-acetylmuramoyl-L-alanine amidase